MNYPQIYLAIDNCFASKRWTKPSEWMEFIKGLGVSYIEASADNECDPLYTDADYLRDWVNEIKRHSQKMGVKVANLYSGHGTYSTLGLAHTDSRIRNRILNGWLKSMVRISANLDAGLGFFCHAFSDSVLQNSILYNESKKDLLERLAELAEYAHEQGLGYIGVEQMYTPHQIPWTVKDSEELLKKVYGRKGKPLYITVDTGHQTGQRKFLKPDYGRIKEYLRNYRTRERTEGMWLGSESAYALFLNASEKSGIFEDSEIEKILQEMDKYPYMFSEYHDGDPYIWLEKLGCYSPIIHVQQTNGKTSSHQPFTKECNEHGIITGEKFFKALYDSYSSRELPACTGISDAQRGTTETLQAEYGLPPKCEKIYITLEIFSGTSDINRDILWRLRESVKYWRHFIPEDGMRLDELIKEGVHDGK